MSELLDMEMGLNVKRKLLPLEWLLRQRDRVHLPFSDKGTSQMCNLVTRHMRV